ncbi:hypothetical protein B0H11DRAFT_1944859 [Mycena galericulata]|nr:hypothetical protein B0H11DRAFT_1944859 [Mycena galericulata]
MYPDLKVAKPSLHNIIAIHTLMQELRFLCPSPTPPFILASSYLTAAPTMYPSSFLKHRIAPSPLERKQHQTVRQTNLPVTLTAAMATAPLSAHDSAIDVSSKDSPQPDSTVEPSNANEMHGTQFIIWTAPPLGCANSKDADRVSVQVLYDAGVPFFTKEAIQDVVDQFDNLMWKEDGTTDDHVFIPALDGNMVEFPVNKGQLAENYTFMWKSVPEKQELAM